MSNRKLVQHRAQRDTNTKESNELRAQNRELKRKVSRLKKELEQAQAHILDPDTAEDLQDKPMLCPKCSSSNLGSTPTPTGRKAFGCLDCKHRWRGTTL